MHSSTSDWNDLLDRSDVLIVDTETTGFDKQAEVVQVAAVDTTGRVRFNELVMPVFPIPEEASSVHGLTHESLLAKGAVEWPNHHWDFCELTSDASAVLVYNLNYDTRILKQTCSHHGLIYQPFRGRCVMLEYAAHRRIPNRWGSGWKWHKLADAAIYERVRPQGKTHAALADCEVVLELMRAVASRVED